ncbi:MAG TPA: hypothetical protein PKD27_13030 [Tepidiformaceae bacterium]|nr:hypothetical protein [Tepidiformaceae bacterium]
MVGDSRTAGCAGHAYERVDYLEIWNIAAAHTPTVLDYVTPLLPRRDASD